MFRKIVSQLSFSPALVGQLSFYARRLRKEQVTRRLGLIFVALAMVVQSLAVFQAPEPANAASPNDFVYGGLGLVSNGTYNYGIFMSAYDRNVNNLKDIMNYVGITRAELEAAGTRVNSNPRSGANLVRITNPNLLSWGHQPRFSSAQGERAVNVTNSSGRHLTTVYARPMGLLSDLRSGYWALQGHSKKFGTFYILQGCGNLVTPFVPSPPAPKPNPPAPPKITLSKSVKNLTRSSGYPQPGDHIQFTLTARNTGGSNGTANFSDNLSNVVPYLTFSGGTRGDQYNSANKTINFGKLTVGPGKTVNRQFTMVVRPFDQLPTNSAGACRATNTFGNTLTIWFQCPKPGEITKTKTVKNLSRSSGYAQPGDKLQFTLTARNTGDIAKQADFRDDVSDVLTFATFTGGSMGGGSYNASTKVISWPNATVGAGKTVTRSFTVVVKPADQLPAIAEGQAPCKISNTYGTTVTVTIKCPTPAKIIQTKSVKNLSRSSGMAQPGDKLRFTLSAQNTGGKPGTASFKDDIKSALKYATLNNRSTGGASYSASNQTLTWQNATVGAGKTVTRSFEVVIKPSNQLPNTHQDPTCRITNTYGTSKVGVDVRCPGPLPPKLVNTKTAKNITRNKAASDVIARSGDKITFTLSTKNTGELTGTAKFSDKLTSIMQYAKLTNTGGGTYDAKTQTLSWPDVKVAAGKTVTRSFTVTVNSSLPISANQCSMANSYGTTVGIGVNCPTPPAEINQSKVAKNMTQGNVDATTVTAKANDRISFTVTVSNTGGTAKKVQLSDALTDTLEYATLIDRGGGTFDEETKTLSWPDVTLQPGDSTSRTFAVQILPEIPATPQGVSDPTSYDCKIVNTFGNSVTIPVDCAGPKVVEQVVTELPTTGAGENITFSAILLAVVTYFFFRSRQLGREVRLIRRDLHAGTI